MEERTMNYIKISILAIALCSTALSCNDEDALQNNVQDSIQDGNQEGTQDNSPNGDQGSAAITLDDALTEWGTPYDDVVAHMDGYESNTTSDENTLHFSDNRGREVAYRFHNNQLCASLVTFDANLQLDYGSLLSDYIYLGELDGCNIHEDIANNTMASVWKEAERVVVGFAPIKSDAYEQAEPIAAITGDCFNIGISTAELSGSVRGVDSSVEVGFIYGTTMDLSETNGIKVSTTSSGDFTINITDLYDETHYYYCAFAIVEDLYYLGEVKEFTTAESGFDNPLDLSAYENANCYIVSKRGTYKFTTAKGNGTERIGNIADVAVLWETFGTGTAPAKGDLISKVIYEDDYVIFKTNSVYKEGNAVIAVMDNNKEILWSWHIWLTDQPNGQTYYNNAGMLMDRNLGATTATAGDVGSIGLLYQWGRKDPFLASCTLNSQWTPLAESTYYWPAPVPSNIYNGTIEYSIANPTTFINGNDNNDDWYYTNTNKTNENRWTAATNKKSIYDPCPAGWRIPDKDTWTKALSTSTNESYYEYDEINKGINFSGYFGSAATIWYPASGYRYCYSGSLYNSCIYGAYWSSSTSHPTNPTNNFFYRGVTLFLSKDNTHTYTMAKASGCSVRCIQE